MKPPAAGSTCGCFDPKAFNKKGTGSELICPCSGEIGSREVPVPFLSDILNRMGWVAPAELDIAITFPAMIDRYRAETLVWRVATCSRANHRRQYGQIRIMVGFRGSQRRWLDFDSVIIPTVLVVKPQ